MANDYRVEIVAPATKALPTQSWTFSAATSNVISVEVELKKDKHRISNLTLRLHDPKREIFGAMPDPAFCTVAVKLYLAPADVPNQQQKLVFDGKVTSLQAQYGDIEETTVVAHDNSIDLRRNKQYRTFTNKTSAQLATAIANTYGLSPVIELGGILLANRSCSFGPEVSDWDLLCRELNFDGLEAYVDGKKLHIRLAANLTYQTTFQAGQPPIYSLECMVEHVGSGVDQKGSVALDNAGTKQALIGPAASEAALANASKRTHRRPIGGRESTVSGSHAESPGSQAWTNEATNFRRRKDTLSITCSALPDLGLQHQIKVAGFGAKIDGNWFVHQINHNIVGSGPPQTTIGAKRAPSPAAQRQTGIVLGQ